MNKEIFAAISRSVVCKESLRQAYQAAQEAGMKNDQIELDKFYRIWELLTRNFYFRNQIENNEKEIQQIINE